MRTRYRAGGALLACALIAAAGIVGTRLAALDDELERWPRGAFAAGSVALDPGEYHVYFDSDRPVFRDTPLTITGPDGGVLPLRPAVRFRYTFGERHGRLLGTVEVRRPGVHALRGAGAPPGTRLIFGDRLVGGIAGSVLLAVAVFLVLGGAGALLIVRPPPDRPRWP